MPVCKVVLTVIEIVPVTDREGQPAIAEPDWYHPEWELPAGNVSQVRSLLSGRRTTRVRVGVETSSVSYTVHFHGSYYSNSNKTPTS
jgi:hypothetical protein